MLTEAIGPAVKPARTILAWKLVSQRTALVHERFRYSPEVPIGTWKTKLLAAPKFIVMVPIVVAVAAEKLTDAFRTNWRTLANAAGPLVVPLVVALFPVAVHSVKASG